ncbi:MAG: Flp pilus assembly protein CpaB [Pelotomaculum thermopropionicum]|uniref:Flp pilus assembly protein CpaB n=1 Tax=Pelotomaculum thermopropionicum TaxID=110500 RepID=A0A101HVH6_9FIRM|nr:MAG: Flp pilus assembly protein CpaB [Pelotomaculum thermopropionicum]
MKNKLILIMAVIAGLAAAGGAYLYLENLKQTYETSGDFIKVVTASQRIPAKTRITARMIELEDIPSKYINNRAAVDTKEVIGKIAKMDILPGEQVLRDRVAGDRDALNDLSLMLQQGKRAVTIPVNEVSGLAGLLRPGDRVDVLGTFDLQGAVGQGKYSITTLLIQNVDVLSVDQNTIPSSGSNNQKDPVPARTITLSVTPEQAQPLVLCSEKGALRLILRPAADREPVTLPSIKMDQLVH